MGENVDKPAPPEWTVGLIIDTSEGEITRKAVCPLVGPMRHLMGDYNVRPAPLREVDAVGAAIASFQPFLCERGFEGGANLVRHLVRFHQPGFTHPANCDLGAETCITPRLVISELLLDRSKVFPFPFVAPLAVAIADGTEHRSKAYNARLISLFPEFGMNCHVRTPLA